MDDGYPFVVETIVATAGIEPATLPTHTGLSMAETASNKLARTLPLITQPLAS